MNIDRLLILCSVMELSFLACHKGLGCFTGFQWAALLLLAVKLAMLLLSRRSPSNAESGSTR